MPKIITGFNLGERVRISPLIWPNKRLTIQPGDLTQLAPYGSGVYGYQKNRVTNPFTNAPEEEPCGGVVYFDNHISRGDFEAFTRIVGVQFPIPAKPSKDFAVFTAESEEPWKDRYFAQMRIVSKYGLRFMFNALTESEYEGFGEQELSIVDTLCLFIERERARLGTEFGDPRIAGLFGGDGDEAREQLAFGFMVENHNHHVYRIWSRAWLVTK
jgi:hypothetical protein